MLFGAFILPLLITGGLLWFGKLPNVAVTSIGPKLLSEIPTLAQSLSDPLAASVTPVPSDSTNYPPITWMQLNNFLAADHTNWNTYNAVTYNCLNYSMDLVKNALKKNIKAWIMAVTFTNQDVGHAFVAFQTSDLGVVYIEPQADDRYMVLEPGKPLCDAWGMYQCLGTVKMIERLDCTSTTDCIASAYKP